MSDQSRSAGGSARMYAAAAVFMLLLAAVPLGVLELTLRWVFPQELHVVGGTNIGYKVDDPEIPEGVLKPNAHMVIAGPEFQVEYRVNEQGIRDAATYTPERPPGAFRILLIGDSFTFGFGNDYDRIWPVVLERDLRRRGYNVEVVKGGVPMYDTRSEALLLKRQMPQYRPDLVLLTFLPNDLFTNTPIDRIPPPEDIEAASTANPFELQVTTLFKRSLMAMDFANLKLYLLKRQQYFQADQSAHVREQYAVSMRNLDWVHRYLADQGVDFAVHSLPQQFQVIHKARAYTVPGLDSDIVDRVFGEHAATAGFGWMSPLAMLVAAYKTTGEDQYYRYDGHLNAHGNRLVGEWLVEEVVRRWGPRLPRS